MTVAALEITTCPPQLQTEALALVLCELAPSQRADVAGSLVSHVGGMPSANDGLLVALREGVLRGATWVQRQPGNTAMFWPPQLVLAEDQTTAKRLAEVAMQYLDATRIAMAQVLLQMHDNSIVPLLKAVGFQHLADLTYLTCEAARFPTNSDNTHKVEFVRYDASQRSEFMHLIERTYEGTLDCPSLNGVRRMEDVLEGYQATGESRAENWLSARIGGEDVGVLLLADHPSARHWELVYMGLAPEARGHGYGRKITEHAQMLARRQNAERIVLAVDAANAPALAMYRATGFEPWDQRTVYVRFCGANA